MIRRGYVLLFVLCAFVATGDTASAYLKLGATAGGSTVSLNWRDMPVRYFVSNRSGGGVTAAQLEQTVIRAFGTWDAVERAELATQFVGVTSAEPVLRDGINTIGFVERPDQDRVLGATNFLIDAVTGELLESDIYLNSSFAWSVAAGGQPDRFDVESIALHEVGHLLGLGHSALGETELHAGGRRVLAAEAVMFPIAFSPGSIEGRTLRADDIAGITDIYPDAAYQRDRGSISGAITKSGQGVIGAHVIAFNTRSGKLVAGFTLTTGGRYVIGGLEEGTYAIRVEPLDDGDIESFFDETLDVDTNFRVKFHDRLIVVPRGGGISNVDVQVVAK